MVIREYRYGKDKEQLATFPYLGRVVSLIDFDKYTYKYVAVENKKVVGFLLAGRSDGGIVILWEVEVLPEFQNKGIAKELILKLEYDMKFRNDRELYLFYNFDPESSLEKFYKKMGFVIGDNLKVASKTIL